MRNLPAARPHTRSSNLDVSRLITRAIVPIFIGGLVFATFWRLLGTYFGVDDFFFLISADAHGLKPPWLALDTFFTRRYLSDVVLFTLCRRAFGDFVPAFRLVGLAMHLVSGYLLYSLAAAVRPGVPGFPVLVSAFFLVHPVVYSVVAWVELGFNEAFALGTTLAGVAFFLRYLDTGAPFRAGAAILCAPVAASFKNQGVLIPLFYACFGLAIHFARSGAGHDIRCQRMRRAAAVVVPCLAFSLWYILSIAPLTPQYGAAAYTRDWSPSSLLDGYSRLLFAAINPFAWFRERLGYQDPIPDGFLAADDGVALTVRLTVIGTVLLTSWLCARRRGEDVRWSLILALAFGSLSFAAALPLQRQEYYAYFGLVPLALIAGYVGDGVLVLRGATLRAVGIALALTVAVFNGAVLHRTNGFVRQARSAEIGVDLARHLAPGADLHFIGPDATAWFGLVYGSAIQAMLPQAALNVTFGHRNERPFDTTRWPGQVLAYFEPRPRTDPLIHVLDMLQNPVGAPVDFLPSAGRLTQRLPTHESEVNGVGIRVSKYPWVVDCSLRIVVSATMGSRRGTLADEDIPCADLVDDAYRVVTFPPHRFSKGEVLEVEIGTRSAAREAVALWVRRGQDGAVIAFRGDGDASARALFSGASLAYLITTSPAW